MCEWGNEHDRCDPSENGVGGLPQDIVLIQMSVEAILMHFEAPFQVKPSLFIQALTVF